VLKADLTQEKALHQKTKFEFQNRKEREDLSIIKKTKEESYQLGRKDQYDED